MRVMKKFLLLAAALIMWAAPASAGQGSTIAKLAITTAQSLQAGAGNCAGASATCSLTRVQVAPSAPENVTVQCNFVYGSGGTSADAWLQTSLDGGTTCTDIAECGFTTSSTASRQLDSIAN
jgi:hypothetical protein